MDESKRTFAEKHPKLNLLLGLILIAIMVIFVICAVKVLCSVTLVGIAKIATAASNLDAVIIVALITGLVTIISSILAKILDYRKNRQVYLSKKREMPYGEFVDMVYKLQKNIKKPGDYSEEQMLEDLSKFSRQMTLWGSPKVVKKWNKFRRNGSDPAKAISSLFLLEDIMNDMRKDLGVGKVKKGNLLGFFVNDIKSAMKNKR